MTPLALILTLIGAIAVDGDTVKLDGQRYRLFGIQAPERGNAGYRAATDALAALIRRKPLSCSVIDIDRYQRPVVQCALPDGRDLSCAMVSTGLAVDWPRYSGGLYAGCGK